MKASNKCHPSVNCNYCGKMNTLVMHVLLENQIARKLTGSSKTLKLIDVLKWVLKLVQELLIIQQLIMTGLKFSML